MQHCVRSYKQYIYLYLTIVFFNLSQIALIANLNLTISGSLSAHLGLKCKSALQTHSLPWKILHWLHNILYMGWYFVQFYTNTEHTLILIFQQSLTFIYFK